MSGDVAAILDGGMGDADGAPVGQGQFADNRLAGLGLGAAREIFADARDWALAGGKAMLENGFPGRPQLGERRRQPVHGYERRIAKYKSRIGVHHAKPVGRVVERRREQVDLSG